MALVLASGTAVAGLAVAGCGVEVPDDVAARATTTTATTEAGPTTTVPPTSDDPLEQWLLDNGYSPAEAECGAGNLRRVLEPDEITTIVEADDVEQIGERAATRFASALRDCLDDG